MSLFSQHDRMRKRYETYKAKGICTYCRKNKVFKERSVAYCEKCLDKQNKQNTKKNKTTRCSNCGELCWSKKGGQCKTRSI